MPTTNVSILGTTLSIAHPYAPGHVCSAAEADALNRLLVKGISKGLFKVLTNARSGLGLAHGETADADQQSELITRAEAYVLEFAEGFAQGHERLRSIRLECDRIARQLLDTQLNREGRTARELSADEQHSRLSELAQSEKVRTEAERRVNVTQEIAQRAHGDLLSSMGD